MERYASLLWRQADSRPRLHIIKDMTLIVGIKCDDGYVVCADSQEPVPLADGIARRVRRLATRAQMKHLPSALGEIAEKLPAVAGE